MTTAPTIPMSVNQQQELLRFLELVQSRIEEVNREKDALTVAVKTLEARLFALERQRDMALAIKDEEQFLSGQTDTWIHISQCSNYPELPAPSTIRQWIKQSKLTENTHFKRVGARSKIYVNPYKLAVMVGGE